MHGWTRCSLALAALLPACAAQCPAPVVHTEYQTVSVPVPTRPAPPPELTARIESRVQFVAPGMPTASSALTADGETALIELIQEYVARLAAWEAWAQ